jgi:hypothetical protein
VDETQAVFIGRDLDRHGDEIRAALAACERPEPPRAAERSADHV